MKIEYHDGDILSVKSGVIFHGCNFRGVYNAGLARQIRQVYPVAYQKYSQFIAECHAKKYTYDDMIGSISFAEVTDDLIIGNVITQDGYGRDKIHIDYEAIRIFLQTIAMCPASIFEDGIHIPKIGCGLAGGDWNIVSSMIESICPYDQTIHVWDNKNKNVYSVIKFDV